MSETIDLALTRGQRARIDRADYPLVAPFSWTAARKGHGRWYARAGVMGADGAWHPVLLHRLLIGAARGVQVRFRDGDSLNCARANLITGGVGLSTTTRAPGSRSPYKGVSPQRDARVARWRAELRIAGRAKLLWLGLHDSEREAAEAWDRAYLANGGDPQLTNAALGPLPFDAERGPPEGDADAAVETGKRRQDRPVKSSPFWGVYHDPDRDRWEAICFDGDLIVHRSAHDDPVEAARAFARAAALVAGRPLDEDDLDAACRAAEAP